MKFSLIVATVGRTAQLARLLESIGAQIWRDFELIVVDQNEDDRLAPLLAPYRDRFEMKHLRSARGLSRARNVGLAQVDGGVIAFPDDDCWYAADILARTAEYLDANPSVAGLTGRIKDGRGNARGRWARHAGAVTKLGLFNRINSITFFVRHEAVERIGGFDETLGLGAPTPWQGGEEYDYVVRMLEAGFTINYDPGLVIFHDEFPSPDESAVTRAHRMCLGTGRFLNKHRYPAWYLSYWFGGSVGLAALALITGKPSHAKYHWVSAIGKIRGWAARA